MPRRSRVEGDSLRAALDVARRTYGPDVRIVSAERVITGGLAGLFGRQRYEIVVEALEPGQGPTPPRTGAFPGSRRPGIAALLDEADDGDQLDPATGRDVEVSTGGEDFAALLSGLVAETTGPGPATEVDGPSTRPGDLVALVGLADDAVAVVRDLAERLGVLPACAGTAGAAGLLRVAGHRDTVEARAMGVRASTSVAVGVGVGRSADAVREVLERLGPDEVWVVVDASRKTEDTQAWVDAVRHVAAVRAMAVVGRELTATPDSVAALGLPEGWTTADIEPGA
ncbi:hypothetical protein LEP48_17430 [Isoptericola sp. NEAU-Y5]|uniref:Uncharacterized protein n=1 Tax=Isoptericola luteus TaxID=2879484 RepID=A0ABS7ZMV9_9MICO|nr:hypothetical protein [Isoptericola sp. NEAU-Y5]MCA5895115.1 hypothetical protein [Isoptericola sp. NEAU-Y5]